jgi:hypothetical protein
LRHRQTHIAESDETDLGHVASGSSRALAETLR